VGKYRRHLEGWQLGVLSVGLALLALALVLPRPVTEAILPLPHVDPALEAHAEQQKAEARARARRVPLPFSVRAVGEAFRRYGRAEVSEDPPQISGALAHLRRTVQLARHDARAELLLELRAVQSELFLGALHDWEVSGERPADLVELGGKFTDRAAEYGWLDGERKLVLRERERAVLFEFRWLQLLGVRDDRAFAPALEEWRRYFRCLLEHPQADPSGAAPDGSRARLAYVNALAKVDPEYPAALARGILHQRLGQPEDARRELERHLQEHPRGPWALRARNHWLATFSP
jgi:hypothetical protein